LLELTNTTQTQQSYRELEASRENCWEEENK
jgi:hypothetical protein